jgi:uncharacterized protein (TIGR02271 family)
MARPLRDVNREEPTVADANQILEYRGQQLHDQHGEKVGKVDEIYFDEHTEAPEWALVTTGLFGSNGTFVPIAHATADGELKVPFDKAHIKGAPNMNPNGELSEEEEAKLYEYYGMDYGREESGSTFAESPPADGQPAEGQPDGDAVGHDVSGPETDNAMTRSEEEVSIGTAQRERGRARLRKYIVTENVTQTVPVTREEVRVEREPITDANVGAATTGGELTEEEHEVVLHEEEVVTEKRVVPKERVRMDKDVQTEQREVSEEVRKEQVEIEGDR